MRFLALLASFLLSLSLGSANGNVPLLFCRKTYDPPEVDGLLDDLCWQEAHGVTGFSLLANGGLAEKQTYGFVLYDNSFLYAGFVCEETAMEGIRSTIRERDGVVWRDDCVEIFMDTNHDHLTYYHVIATVAGVRYDEIGKLQPWTWNCDWAVSVGTHPDGWTAEIAIPFSCMQLETPRPGEIWGFNLNREEWQLAERSGWSPSWVDFHEPQSFGHLIFEPES